MPELRRLDVGRALSGERIDRVVALACGLARGTAAELIANGSVSVNGTAVRTRSRRVAEGEAIEVRVPPAIVADLPSADPGVRVPIVAADDHVIVVDKPAGLVVHPGAGRDGATLVHGLLALYPDMATVGAPSRPGIVHRLDAGTSGLLVVARTDVAYVSLVSQLAQRSVERRYLTLAWGHFESQAGMIDGPVGRSSRDRTRMAVTTTGREARTRYRVLESFDEPADVSLVECWLETGRTHQIRVHLKAMGHPVVGDSRYGGARAVLPLDRPFLHAHRLAFDHPVSNEKMGFDSQLPGELKDVRELLH